MAGTAPPTKLRGNSRVLQRRKTTLAYAGRRMQTAYSEKPDEPGPGSAAQVRLPADEMYRETPMQSPPNNETRRLRIGSSISVAYYSVKNPKHEIRNPKQIQNTNFKNAQSKGFLT